MAKVDFAASVTADAAMAVDTSPAVALPPRHNLYCKNDSGRCEYVTTERAESFEAACALAFEKYPGWEFTDRPPRDLSKMIKPKDSPRKNLFVMCEGEPEYFTTERAETHAEAKALAQAKYPGVELLCEDDLI